MYPRVMLVSGDPSVYQIVDRTFGRAQFDLLLVVETDDVIEFASWAEPDLVMLAYSRIDDSLRVGQQLRSLRGQVRARLVIMATRVALHHARFEQLTCADAVLALPLDNPVSIEHLRDKWFPEALAGLPRTLEPREALWT